MKEIPEAAIDFLRTQSFAIVSTIDKHGFPHASCKDIGKIDPQGKVYLIDAYHGVTAENIERNSQVSINLVDEHKFIGYCFKGRAKLVPIDNLSQKVIKTWEDNITSRLAKRLLRNLSGDKGHVSHPEASLPHPKHVIMIEIEEIVDLAPHQIRKES